MKATRLIILGLAAATVAGAQAVVLDDFTTGAYSVEIGPAVGSSDLHFQAASVIGGIRATYLKILQNPRNGKLAMQTGPIDGFGFHSVAADNRLVGFTQLGYGFSTSSVGSNPLNANWSGLNKLNVNFDSNDLDLSMMVTVVSNVEGSFNFIQTSRTVLGGRPATAFTESFDLSGLAQRNDVDAVLLEFTTSPGGDFALTSVEAVPEPASIAAIALGALGILGRRRKA